MGNNSAFSAFEVVTHILYKAGVLTLPLLVDVAKAFHDQDADSGGYEGYLSDDRLNLLDIVIKVSGEDVSKPVLPDRVEEWTADHENEDYKWREKQWEIFSRITGL